MNEEQSREREKNLCLVPEMRGRGKKHHGETRFRMALKAELEREV